MGLYSRLCTEDWKGPGSYNYTELRDIFKKLGEAIFVELKKYKYKIMKILSEYIKESSSLFYDVINPYEFDMKKSLANSEFSIRVHKYENGELVLNDDYFETDSIRKFRTVLKKITAFQEFSAADKEKYMMSVNWGSDDKPRNVIYLTLYVSGAYNENLCLIIDLQSEKIYEVDPFDNIKYPGKRDKDKLIRIIKIVPASQWDGKFI